MTMTPLVTLALIFTAATGGLKSGPQVGTALPGPFEPLHLTGPDAGDEACFFCKYGNAPVVMVFARTTSPGLTELTKKLEKAAVEHRAAKLGTCVIFLDTSDALKERAKRIAGETGLRETILACIEPEKMKEYELDAGADVTVLLYNRRTVRANHALKANELNTAVIDSVIADLVNILPAK
jgi:hypothetical protein